MAVKPHISASVFERIAANSEPCELERGEVVTLSPGGMPHSRFVSNFAYLLEHWARQSRRGRVCINETGLITERAPDTVRGVDVAYFSYQRLPKSQMPAGFTDVPPTVAVEVVGKGQGWKKMVEKAGEYLRMGVDQIWVVDPKKRRVCIFRPDDEPEILDQSMTIRDVALLPGFQCRVREFFV